MDDSTVGMVLSAQHHSEMQNALKEKSVSQFPLEG